MLPSRCKIILLDPEIVGEWVEWMLYSNGGGNRGDCFLSIPEKHCAIWYKKQNCGGSCEKISSADLRQKLEVLGIQLSSGKIVKVEKGMAEIIASESTDKGAFTDLEEIKKRYKDVSNLFWLAKVKAEELYFKTRYLK